MWDRGNADGGNGIEGMGLGMEMCVGEWGWKWGWREWGLGNEDGDGCRGMGAEE